MSGLLPDAVADTIRLRSLFTATQTFGVVVLILLLAVLLNREVMSTVRAPSPPNSLVAAVTVPLLAVFLAVVGARLWSLLP